MRAALATLREDLSAAGQALRRIRVESRIIAALVLALIGSWIWFAAELPAAFLPSPAETGDALYDMLADRRGDYLRAIGETLSVFLTGLLAASLAGGGLTFLMGAFPLAGRVLSPCFDLLASVPNIALMPLIVAFLGLGPEAKICVVFLAALIPLVVSGAAALRQISPLYAEAAMNLGASRTTAWAKAVWPQALPQMIAAVRVGASQGLTACVVAEIYTAMTGLGGLVAGYGSAFNMPRYFVVVLTLAVIGATLSTALRRLEARLRRRLFAERTL